MDDYSGRLDAHLRECMSQSQAVNDRLINIENTLELANKQRSASQAEIRRYSFVIIGALVSGLLFLLIHGIPYATPQDMDKIITNLERLTTAQTTGAAIRDTEILEINTRVQKLELDERIINTQKRH